jgi:lipooligosaccharide transport system permease protein
MATPIAVRVLEGHVRSYRHTWRGTTISSVATPVLFLAAMGLGLGQLVDGGRGIDVAGDVSYLAWLAPGLLVVSAMQGGAGDGAFPVMAGMRWVGTYHAMAATPVRPSDLLIGNLAWAAIRLGVIGAVFVLIATAFGAMSIGPGMRSLAPAVLTGLATCAAVSAFIATRRSDLAMSGLMRFVVVPLFLFSGAFFPLSELPAGVEPIAQLNPVWHGVELARSLALDLPPALAWPVHLGVLVVVLVAGVALGLRAFAKELRS